ncbi:FAD/NAD(P)-binding domain-containing protein [Thozetella sp. PMI_491]|nr:FAD/NAD(P)-binding domain-containing protein [Thozetella sp. PMI_491]
MAKKRVAIIGTGPAGAIATDALVKEQAFDTIRVFERQSRIGGTWVYTPRLPRSLSDFGSLLEQKADLPVQIPSRLPCETASLDEVNSYQARFSDTAAHEYLHSNLPPDVMAFTQEPIPALVSDRTRSQYGSDAPFRHRELLREWTEDIFTRGAHGSLVEFNTTVELAEKVGDEWVLTLRKVVSGEMRNTWWQETFDAVVVATGHYYLPHIPKIPGLLEYQNKYPERILHTKHYPTAEQFRGKRVLVVGGSVSAFDAIHDILPISGGPVISSLRKPNALFGWAPFTHPNIVNKPQISSFDSNTGRIVFQDESWVEEVDSIIFATGYQFSFPFLKDVQPRHGRIPGLYEHVFQTSDPSLAFIGMVTGGFGIRIFEWQAVAAARVLAGRSKLPSRREMEQWEADRVVEKGDTAAFWALLPDFEKHFEALRNIAGEPAPGSTGRVLPKYDPSWEESFWKLIKYRVDWWTRQATAAQGTRPSL